MNCYCTTILLKLFQVEYYIARTGENIRAISHIFQIKLFQMMKAQFSPVDDVMI